MARPNTWLSVVGVGLLQIACGGSGSSDLGDRAAAGSSSLAGNAEQGTAGVSPAGSAGGGGGGNTAGGTGGGGAGNTAGGTGGGGAGNTAGRAGGGAAGSMPTSCSDFATLVCSNFGSCAPIYLAEQLGSLASCVTNLTGVCDHFASVGKPINVARCIGAVAAPDCNGINAERALPDACLEPPGPQAVGASCASNSDCESLLCVDNESACGKCAARGVLGKPCSSGSPCELNLVCDRGTCATPSARDATCDPAKELRCPNGTYCGTAGVCKSWGGAGEPCDTARPCDGPHGFFCANGQCVTIKVAAENEACGIPALAGCQAGTMCKGSICVKTSELGGSCGTGTGCSFPLWCSSLTCSYEGTPSCR